MDTIFFSYSRVDSPFVLKLAKDLREAGVNVWLDQLDIAAGSHWDSSIEKALHSSKTLLIILSSTSVASDNVMDEVSYALEEGKTVIPILLSNCDTPFRLRRLQRIDFTGDYQSGFNSLLEAINVKETNRTNKINTISETIHKANSPKTEAAATLPATPKGKSKMGILITIGVIVLAFATWGISKMGGKKDKDESKELNTNATKPDQTPDNAYIIDITNYYFIENRYKGYLMATSDSSMDEDADIVVLNKAEGQNDFMKFELSGIDPYIVIAKHSGQCVTVYDNNFLGQQKIPETIAAFQQFRFRKFKEGYFQIEDLAQTGNVLGLDRASEGFDVGQKVISMKNDSSIQTQWKLIPSGDKVEN
jgi:hypothetical protein